VEPPLRIAVVGLGRVGWSFHFKRAAASPDFTMAAVVDPLRKRREEAEKEAGCRSYATVKSLLDKEELDVVAIASPTRLHERQTRACLKAGCHVVLEKPMTTGLRSADRIVREAERCGRRVMVYQPHRLTAETQTLKGILDSGIIGPVHLMRRTACRYTRRSDWQSLKKHGGGMLNNYGAHFVDLLMYLSDGSPIEDIRCALWAVATRGDADDVVRAWLRTREGQLLDVEINQATAWPQPPWHVNGAYGTVVLEDRTFKVRYYDPAEAPPLEVTEGAAPGRSYDNRDRLPWQEKEVPVDPAKQLDFYRNVRAVIVDGAEPLVPLHASRELMRVIETCRRRAKF
jgi:predicted dehydrogenase